MWVLRILNFGSHTLRTNVLAYQSISPASTDRFVVSVKLTQVILYFFINKLALIPPMSDMDNAVNKGSIS